MKNYAVEMISVGIDRIGLGRDDWIFQPKRRTFNAD